MEEECIHLALDEYWDKEPDRPYWGTKTVSTNTSIPEDKIPVIKQVLGKRKEMEKKWTNVKQEFTEIHAIVEQIMKEYNRSYKNLPEILEKRRENNGKTFDSDLFSKLSSMSSKLDDDSSIGAKIMQTIFEFNMFTMEMGHMDKQLTTDIDMLTPQFNQAMQTLKHNFGRETREKAQILNLTGQIAVSTCEQSAKRLKKKFKGLNTKIKKEIMNKLK
jgi:hypothetical protein